MKRHLALLVQVAGLFATGWVVWTAAIVPKLTRLPLLVILSAALEHALLACAASVLITIGLYLLIARSSRTDAMIAALRTSSTAVWFAPAALLLSALSPLFFAAAFVLVISATRLLYLEWRAIHPERTATVAVERDLFEPPASPFRLRDLAPSLIASLGLEMGTVGVLVGNPLPAAILFCLATAMLTYAALNAGAYQPQTQRSLPRSILGLALTIILAVGFTVGGMANRIRHGRSPWDFSHRGGPVETLRALLGHLLHADDPGQRKGTVTTLYTPPTGNVEIDDKSFPGVVLFSEPKPTAKLVAPRAGWIHATLPAIQEVPSVIPFSGEYWMFRPPQTQPPRNSYARWGTPLSQSFLTTDHAPMAMEAHQKLPHAIDLSCCAEIQVVISNSDRYPATVSLELIAGDGAGRQSLGSADVPSSPSVAMHFTIPPNSAVRQCSELTIVFHRDRVRIERSARIAIEKFVLTPRL